MSEEGLLVSNLPQGGEYFVAGFDAEKRINITNAVILRCSHPSFPCRLPLRRSHSRRIKARQQDLHHDVLPWICCVVTNHCRSPASFPGGTSPHKKPTSNSLSAWERSNSQQNPEYLRRAFPGLLRRQFDRVTQDELKAVSTTV